MEFHMLCGLPGSGKSTLVNRLQGYVVSTDSIRKFLWQDEAIICHDQLVFEIARQMIDYMLPRGNTVIFDATNMTRRNRKPFIQLAHKHGATITLHWVKTSLETALARNASRDRKVPVAVIRSMNKRFQPPRKDETIDHIVEYEEEGME
ncbi:AAA family ATPase [Heliobacillus mobilis]|uniref:AAA family ATPase n=1 Tax=Heliobacterium mobile TaxID=28064 RepID=A0A6I3SHF7_HELMO|nr:ATP-binding protein [Heliobacterium mobile]MTV48299.1 AAA family ATPase [Heliobacterium mobile]